MLYCDYSSYKTWMRCPWNWYEVYVNKRRKKYPEKQRDDPLAIGSLVHAGLENWQRNQIPSIPEATTAEIGPTKEAFALASGLVLRYAQKYPQETWPLVVCEKPLVFPVIDGVTGVAKLDAYFYVPEQTTVESGLPGMTLELSRGWWGHEYKTKDQSFDIGKYMQSWKTAMQASFQLLALQHQLEKERWEPSYDGVQGVLVNVLEKPKIYIPKRKCRGCEGYAEFGAWSPAGSKVTKGKEVMLYSCPNCRNIQSLAPVSTEERPQGECFRMIVQRGPEELEQAQREIRSVALNMKGMAEDHFTLVAPNRDNCYDWRQGECRYYHPHNGGESTLTSLEYEPAEDYLGLGEEEVG
jgi:hypothetical protein